MAATVDPSPAGRLSLQGLHPGNFAMVMASGIVSIGFSVLGFDLPALPFAMRRRRAHQPRGPRGTEERGPAAAAREAN